MRGCLAVLVLAAAFLIGAVWVGGPPLAAVGVGMGLREAGFVGRGMTVDVVTDPPLELLTGRVDRVEIGANDVVFDRLAARRLDLVLLDVHLLDRAFAAVDGVLHDAAIAQGDGSVPVERIDLDGPAGAARAVVTIDGADVERLATTALNDRIGLPLGSVTLHAPDLLRLSVPTGSFDGRLVIEPDGGLAVATDSPGNLRVVIVEPDPLVLRSVTVIDGQLILTGTFDLASELDF